MDFAFSSAAWTITVSPMGGGGGGGEEGGLARISAVLAEMTASAASEASAVLRWVKAKVTGLGRDGEGF